MYFYPYQFGGCPSCGRCPQCGSYRPQTQPLGTTWGGYGGLQQAANGGYGISNNNFQQALQIQSFKIRKDGADEIGEFVMDESVVYLHPERLNQ